jgi:hypothetical protein
MTRRGWADWRNVRLIQITRLRGVVRALFIFGRGSGLFCALVPPPNRAREAQTYLIKGDISHEALPTRSSITPLRFGVGV